ncbi:SigE family RNA polymerase sigma factor [Streptomyces sp. NPDC051320]|uniref:SigE family RNA polymerase sigma factor n=1 Tax=Streptomyces sp. NPDC051320 TaxID=3154644 RepID=UPI003413E0B6
MWKNSDRLKGWGTVASSEELGQFEEFARAGSPRLFRTALLLCGDWHLAEDLVQTALGKAYASWSKVRRADHPDAYVRTVLMRTYISHTRLRRSAERPVSAVPEGAVAEADTALRVTLLAALRELPVRERAVVVLRYWEDRSVAETANELGLSQGSVRNQSARGLSRLRELIDGEHSSFAPR